MSKPAVSAYIRTLREARNMTRPALAKRTGIALRTIENFETTHSDMHFSNMCLMLNAVRGMPQHIHQLFLDANATEQDGRDLAQAFFQSETASDQPPERSFRETDEQTRALRMYVRTLREHIGIAAYPLSDALVELFQNFRDWELADMLGRRQALNDRIGMYVWMLCEDMLQLLLATAVRSDQGRRLAIQRSHILNQSRFGYEPKAGFLLHTSQLAIVQQRLRTLEMMFVRCHPHTGSEPNGQGTWNGEAPTEQPA